MKQTSGPIYQQIQEYLEGLIENGSLIGGSQVPSERTLMKQFKTSNMPVRQAIQHFIHKGIFERIHGRGTFVCKEALELTNRIAVLYAHDNVGMWRSPFYMDILIGIEGVTVQENKQLLLQSVGNGDIYKNLCKLEDDVDGFLVLDLFPSMVEAVEKYIREKRKPIMVINYPHNWTHCQSVVTDNTNNSLLLTQYLIEQGHKRIAFFKHRSHLKDQIQQIHPTSNMKQLGYRKALELHDIPYEQSLVYELVEDNIESCIKDLIENGVTAIYASASHMAVRHILPTLQGMGLSVPEDFSLVAYDDTIDTAESSPPLTVIDTDISLLGSVAAKRLLDLVAGDNETFATTVLQGGIRLRSSVKTIIDKSEDA